MTIVVSLKYLYLNCFITLNYLIIINNGCFNIFLILNVLQIYHLWSEKNLRFIGCVLALGGCLNLNIITIHHASAANR